MGLREENQLAYLFNVFYEAYEDGGFFSINFTCSDGNKKLKHTMDILIK